MVLVLAAKVDDKDREKIFKKIGSWLEEKSAKVTKSEHTGTKELVYVIKGNRKGDFWILDVESEAPIKLTELNLYLNREVNIIRYLILKYA